MILSVSCWWDELLSLLSVRFVLSTFVAIKEVSSDLCGCKVHLSSFCWPLAVWEGPFQYRLGMSGAGLMSEVVLCGDVVICCSEAGGLRCERFEPNWILLEPVA